MKLIKQDIPFTMVANEVLTRKDLSFQEKGLFAYLFSKPEGWDFSSDRIAHETSENRKTVQRVLRKLEDAGLLRRERRSDGKVDYFISYSQEKRDATIPMFGGVVKSGLIGKFEGFKADKSPLTLKGGKPGVVVVAGSEMAGEDVFSGALTNAIIHDFEALNPSFERLFRNKTQRAAVERLIKKYGVDGVKGMITGAKECIGKNYCPTITTPVQLEEKLGMLVSAMKRMGSTPPSVMTI